MVVFYSGPIGREKLKLCPHLTLESACSRADKRALAFTSSASVAVPHAVVVGGPNVQSLLPTAMGGRILGTQ